MKKLFIITLLLIPVSILSAFDFTTGFDLNYDIDAEQPFYQYLEVDVEHETEYINFFWNFSICNDLKYQPSHGESLYFGFYFYMENGGVELNWEDISFTLGRTALDDEVDSPYSLFVSSKLPSALLADFSFDDGLFFFTSRWIELNRDSNLDYPDRGWQYNSYGIYLGNWRIGFQDSSVYTGTSFDPEYFLNPLPGFLKQYTLFTSGKPWSSGGNANSIIGFFTDYTADDYYFYGQFLIDDFTNILGMFDEDAFHNPNKIAWSLGGDYDFDFGKVGFYHAGATKYTFQSYGTSSSDEQYGYTFYPDVTYTANGVLMPIELEDNYLGYYNGENNLSFIVNYEETLYDLGFYAELEFSISGEKSPANPWHEYNHFQNDDPFMLFMLDSERLEKKLTLTAGASRDMKELGLPNLVLSASLEVGYIWNVLELVDTLTSDYTQIQYWQPSENNAAVFAVAIGGRYTF